jgi:hypothetical protein
MSLRTWEGWDLVQELVGAYHGLTLARSMDSHTQKMEEVEMDTGRRAIVGDCESCL